MGETRGTFASTPNPAPLAMRLLLGNLGHSLGLREEELRIGQPLHYQLGESWEATGSAWKETGLPRVWGCRKWFGPGEKGTFGAGWGCNK